MDLISPVKTAKCNRIGHVRGNQVIHFEIIE